MAKKGRTKKKKSVDYSMSPRMAASNSVKNFNRNRALDRFKERFPGVGAEGRKLHLGCCRVIQSALAGQGHLVVECVVRWLRWQTVPPASQPFFLFFQARGPCLGFLGFLLSHGFPD